MNTDESLPLMTWRARPDMSCERVSEAWLDFTGLTPEAALGEGWTRGVHPEDLARWLDTCVRAFDERQPFEIEYRLRHHDGGYRWILERAAPVYSEHGGFLGYAGACVDIEEQKRVQQGLARALERERRLRLAAEEAGRLRQGLTVSVLRELQSPAQAIATWAAHLREQLPDSSDARQALSSIERNARDQSRVISNLLDLEHATAPEIPVCRNGHDHPLLAGVKVLVVEHDRAARDTLVRVLGVAGADVRAVTSTADALDTLGAWQPDVLLSAEGDSLIRALRSLPAERGGCLRAAALGGATLRSGYDAQLAKPVEPVALLATVARLAA
jgi:PAS domain S-box-containing protein